MEEPILNSFLIIDDDDLTIMALKSLIDKTYLNSIIYTSQDGNQGWDLIQRHHPNIVICNLTMPGLDGMQICKLLRAKKELSDIYFIILTATLDKVQKMKAIEGGADDFINKPVNSDELLMRIRSASRYVGLYKKITEEHSLLNELADELEKNIEDMTIMALSIQSSRIPTATELISNVSEAALWIAETLGEISQEDLLDLEIATQLCYIGKICLPDNLINTPMLTNGLPSHNLMFNVPITAGNIASKVRRFKDVANILYHIYENPDGSGFPGKLRGWQIPIGSRIIRVVLDFEEMRFFRRLPVKNILDILYREAKRLYDHRIVVLLEQYLAYTKSFSGLQNEKILSLQDLENGMVVSRDIITSNGLKLISAGVVLHDDIIGKLISHNLSDPILGHIFVRTD